MAVDTSALAERLHLSYRAADPVDPASLPPALTLDRAYDVQDALVDRRVPEEGAVVGYKVGCTSDAVQATLGIDHPVYGRVLGDTVREDHRFETARLVDPRVEPEIAVVLGADLSPPVSRLDALRAVDAVVPVVEVVDCRIRDWELTAATAVADDALAAGLVVGDRTTAPTTVDLAAEGVELLVDGERRATGTGAAVLGHPADAVAWLAEALSERGDALEAGDVVTTGSITEPIPVAAGETVVARFSSLGTVVAHAA